MIKITFNSAIACALFLCSGTMAVAGLPYNMTIQAPGSQSKPHVAQPALQPKPVISRSVGKKKSVQKKPGRAHSPVRQGALRPTEPKSRIPGVPVHRPAPAISIKQHLPVGTSGLGNRFGAGSHNSVPASRVRSGKTGGGGFAPPHRGGFAPARPLGSNGTTSGGSGSSLSHSRGGFAPAGLAGKVHVRNALSSQQLAQIVGFKASWERYKHAMEEQRRREEAALQARIRQLSHEAYISGADCNDNDPEVRPDLLERCDGKDNNCNGQIDEGVKMLKFFDADADGHGDPARSVEVCAYESTRDSEHLSDMNNDCDDNDRAHWFDCPEAGSSR